MTKSEKTDLNNRLPTFRQNFQVS